MTIAYSKSTPRFEEDSRDLAYLTVNFSAPILRYRRTAGEFADLIVGHLNYQLKADAHYHADKFSDPMINYPGDSVTSINFEFPEGYGLYREDQRERAMEFIEDFFGNFQGTVAAGSPPRRDDTQLIDGTDEFEDVIHLDYSVSVMDRDGRIALAFSVENGHDVTVVVNNGVRIPTPGATAEAPVADREPAHPHLDSVVESSVVESYEKRIRAMEEQHALRVAQLEAEVRVAKEQLEVRTFELASLYQIITKRNQVGLT